VSNGTVALHLALTALGIGPGDEVIVPSLTYIATANAVRYCGAEPVFADVTLDDWGLDVDSVERLVNERTKAVIMVHLYGLPANYLALRRVCSENGLFLVEDAAEAPLARRDGVTCGAMGDVATFSFYGNKVLTSGEGGAVTTNDPVLADRMALLRGQGMDPHRRYWFPVVGHNFRLTNLAAAILCGQIERLDDILKRRREVFAMYDRAFAEMVEVSSFPRVPGAENSPWLYCVLLDHPEDRDRLAKHLQAVGIDSRPFFIPLHQMPPYAGATTDGKLPVTCDLSERGLNLPTFSGMTDSQVELVIDSVRSFCGS
jgi:perosamine synthetase